MPPALFVVVTSRSGTSWVFDLCASHPDMSMGYESKLPPKVRDILTDKRGRNTAAPGMGRHAMDPKTDPKRHIVHEFARSIAEMLGETAQAGFYDRLILVAPPKTLGDLRSELPRHAETRVTATVDKDLVNLDDRAIERHLIADEVLV